jgi:hypothetical protein
MDQSQPVAVRVIAAIRSAECPAAETMLRALAAFLLAARRRPIKYQGCKEKQ